MTSSGRIQIMSVLLVLVTMTHALGQSDAKKAFDDQKYKEAVEAWNELLKENPDLKDIHYNQGNANYRLGELDDAIGSYEQALSLKDKNALADVYYNLGNAYLNKQDVEKARQFYKQALRIRPHDEDAKANLELLNHMPPPPPQEQKSQDGEKNQENKDKQEQQQEQQKQQNSESEDQNDQQQQEQQQKQEDSQKEQKNQQKQDEQQSQDKQDKEQDQQQQASSSKDEKGIDKEALMNAQQLLDALKDRETENMREQIRLKTSGRDKEKDW